VSTRKVTWSITDVKNIRVYHAYIIARFHVNRLHSISLPRDYGYLCNFY